MAFLRNFALWALALTLIAEVPSLSNIPVGVKKSTAPAFGSEALMLALRSRFTTPFIGPPYLSRLLPSYAQAVPTRSATNPQEGLQALQERLFQRMATTHTGFSGNLPPPPPGEGGDDWDGTSPEPIYYVHSDIVRIEGTDYFIGRRKSSQEGVNYLYRLADGHPKRIARKDDPERAMRDLYGRIALHHSAGIQDVIFVAEHGHEGQLLLSAMIVLRKDLYPYSFTHAQSGTYALGTDLMASSADGALVGSVVVHISNHKRASLIPLSDDFKARSLISYRGSLYIYGLQQQTPTLVEVRGREVHSLSLPPDPLEAFYPRGDGLYMTLRTGSARHSQGAGERAIYRLYPGASPEYFGVITRPPFYTRLLSPESDTFFDVANGSVFCLTPELAQDAEGRSEVTKWTIQRVQKGTTAVVASWNNLWGEPYDFKVVGNRAYVLSHDDRMQRLSEIPLKGNGETYSLDTVLLEGLSCPTTHEHRLHLVAYTTIERRKPKAMQVVLDLIDKRSSYPLVLAVNPHHKVEVVHRLIGYDRVLGLYSANGTLYALAHESHWFTADLHCVVLRLDPGRKPAVVARFSNVPRHVSFDVESVSGVVEEADGTLHIDRHPLDEIHADSPLALGDAFYALSDPMTVHDALRLSGLPGLDEKDGSVVPKAGLAIVAYHPVTGLIQEVDINDPEPFAPGTVFFLGRLTRPPSVGDPPPTTVLAPQTAEITHHGTLSDLDLMSDLVAIEGHSFFVAQARSISPHQPSRPGVFKIDERGEVKPLPIENVESVSSLVRQREHLVISAILTSGEEAILDVDTNGQLIRGQVLQTQRGQEKLGDITLQYSTLDTVFFSVHSQAWLPIEHRWDEKQLHLYERSGNSLLPICDFQTILPVEDPSLDYDRMLGVVPFGPDLIVAMRIAKHHGDFHLFRMRQNGLLSRLVPPAGSGTLLPKLFSTPQGVYLVSKTPTPDPQEYEKEVIVKLNLTADAQRVTWGTIRLPDGLGQLDNFTWFHRNLYFTAYNNHNGAHDLMHFTDRGECERVLTLPDYPEALFTDDYHLYLQSGGESVRLYPSIYNLGPRDHLHSGRVVGSSA